MYCLMNHGKLKTDPDHSFVHSFCLVFLRHYLSCRFRPSHSLLPAYNPFPPLFLPVSPPDLLHPLTHLLPLPSDYLSSTLYRPTSTSPLLNLKAYRLDSSINDFDTTLLTTAKRACICFYRLNTVTVSASPTADSYCIHTPILNVYYIWSIMYRPYSHHSSSCLFGI